MPTEPVLVVRRWHDGRRVGQLMRWGLIPGWAKDLENDRDAWPPRGARRFGEKASFRGPLRHKRCLFPADGFYVGKRGQRRYLVRRRDGGLLAIAGLYEEWMGADGSEIDSAAIITMAADRTRSRDMATRVPATVGVDGAFEVWLDCRGSTVAEALEVVGIEPPDLRRDGDR